MPEWDSGAFISVHATHPHHAMPNRTIRPTTFLVSRILSYRTHTQVAAFTSAEFYRGRRAGEGNSGSSYLREVTDMGYKPRLVVKIDTVGPEWVSDSALMLP